MANTSASLGKNEDYKILITLLNQQYESKNIKQKPHLQVQEEDLQMQKL